MIKIQCNLLFVADWYCQYAGKVSVPRQLVIKRDASSIPDAVNRAGLRLPLGTLHFLVNSCH